ncbi:MAG: hypothetical protein WCL18_09750 [bacterium]
MITIQVCGTTGVCGGICDVALPKTLRGGELNVERWGRKINDYIVHMLINWIFYKENRIPYIDNHQYLYILKKKSARKNDI